MQIALSLAIVRLRNGTGAGGAVTPPTMDLMYWPDGTQMYWPDGTAMKWPDSA